MCSPLPWCWRVLVATLVSIRCTCFRVKFLTRSGEGREWPLTISKLTSPPSEECFGWSFPPLAKFQNHSFQSIPVLLPSTGECWEPYIFFIETYQPELVLGQNSNKFFFQCWYGFFRSQTSLVVQRVIVHKLKKQVKYQLCFVKSLYDAWLSAVYLKRVMLNSKLTNLQPSLWNS